MTAELYQIEVLAKILSWAQFVNKAGELKKSGAKIVFSNGCFDILHKGHLRYLSLAKQHGDYLFLGVNSDKSVKQLKGDKRPINNQQDRQEMLAGLNMVDFVTSFDQLTPLELIIDLKPDVLVKGGDWEIDKIVGAEQVKKNGGIVLAVPYIKDNSTTGTIDKILKNYGA